MRETFHRIDRRDAAVLFGVTAVLLAAILFLCGTTFWYGSEVDWLSQHSVLPDYYRQRWYATGDFLPEFALNLGAGQNAYNFAYYGFLNPVTLVSYLMPGVPMTTYVQVSSVVMLLLSVYGAFFWLKHMQTYGGKLGVCLSDAAIRVTTVLYAFSATLLFHSHKQIMFVSYLPFLFLALIGVDRFFARGKRGTLIAGSLLLVLNSFFFALPGFLAITIYGIYRWYASTTGRSFRSFLRAGIPFALCMIAAGLASGILVLPSLYTILAGRGQGVRASESKLSLLFPEFPVHSWFYAGYGIGMTAVVAVAVIGAITSLRAPEETSSGAEKPSDAEKLSDAETLSDAKNAASPVKDIFRSRGLSILAIALLVCSLPLCRYVFNGFLYARDKVMIPFAPLAALLTAVFLTELSEHRMNPRKLRIIVPAVIAYALLSAIVTGYWGETALFAGDIVIVAGTSVLKDTRKRMAGVIAPSVLIALVCTVAYSAGDTLTKREYGEALHAEAKTELFEKAGEEPDAQNAWSRDVLLWRSNDLTVADLTADILYTPNYRTTAFYSSLYNRNYIESVYRDLEIPNASVNEISVSHIPDILFQTRMGVRYMVSEGDAPAGCVPVREEDGYTLWRNDGAYTIAYATSRKMSLREFCSLAPADREVALLSYAVVDEDLPDVYVSPIEDTGLSPEFDFSKTDDGNLHVKTGAEATYTVPIPDSLDQYLYIVQTKLMERHEHRIFITVNGVSDILSGSTNANPNDNFLMHFVLSSQKPCNELTFEFQTNAEYDCESFTIRRMPVAAITQARESVTMADVLMTPDTKPREPEGVLEGQIAPQQDGILCFSIPYDENLILTVDGAEVPIFNVNNGYVGSEITAGVHTFRLAYRAPMRNAGIYMSLAGIALWIALAVTQRFRKKD